ncbi:RHS repeat-associated core domain-containing protein [Actinomadura sp. LOL_016]|uniref:RHS repeat-associated core domain-containing protein n=1 Tax=unclassified Actinomadura TaxID=2626254 RepID=UPI003A806648
MGGGRGNRGNGGNGGRGGRGGNAASNVGGVFGRASFPAPRRSGSGGGTPALPPGRNRPGGGPSGGNPRGGGNQQSQGRPTGNTPTASDPVGIVAGEVMLSQTDVTLPAVMPLVLQRTHISTYRAGDLFGPSWASTLDIALQLDSEGVRFLQEDGSVRTYPQALLPNVEFLPTAGPKHPLVLTGDGGYRLTNPQTGVTLHFPAPGADTGWSRLPLVAVTDRNGNRIEFVHEEQVLVEVRHSGGYRVIVDTAPFGDERRVTALRTPDGTVLRRFGYDPDTGDLTEVFDSTGVPQRFSYDEHRLTGWTDRNDHWFRYVYDGAGRAVRTESSDGVLSATLAYDPDNALTRVTDARGHTTVYRYNERHQIVEVVDPLGNATRSEWDDGDRLLSTTDPLGATTRYSYDDRGNLVRVDYPDGTSASTEYDELNLPVRFVQADGAVWTQEYDERGNAVRVTDPAGNTTTTEYTANGAIAAVTDALGHTTRAETDAAGRTVAITDPTGAVTRTELDALGRPVSLTDPIGGVTRLEWTVEGRLLSRAHPDGSTDRWRYDGEGNQIEHVDPLGQTTRSEFGPLDLPTRVTRPDGSTLTFAHDAEMHLTSVTTTDGLSWAYEYDPNGNLLAETDFNGRAVRYSYDAAGRLVTRTNGAGETTSFTRDVLGNTVRTDAMGKVTTFAHDAMGRVTEARNPDATVVRTYDPLGELLTETVNGATVAYERDALGRVRSRTTPSGIRSSWTHDATGLPTSLAAGGQTLTFAYDAAGRETERRVGPAAALVQRWDAAHRLTGQTVWGAPAAPGGQARLLQHRTYAYRPDGGLTGVTDRLTGNRGYTLDGRGRITAVQAQGWTERYAYDDAGNLAHAEHPAADPDTAGSGARAHTGTLVRSAGRTRYEHDAQGRVVLRERVTLSGKRMRWRFHWDAEDRLIGAETPDGSRWSYHYDPFGRRTAKQRLATDAGAAPEVYLFAWDGTSLAEQVHREGGHSRVTTWDYLPGTHTPVAQTSAERAASAPQGWIDRRFQAIVTNLTGAPTELLSPDGTTTAVPPATPWDVPTTSRPGPCPLRHPGQYHDPETGLSYNFNRYYDPETGGYASPDPLGLAPQPNAHAYVPNPTTWIDPLGLSPRFTAGPNGTVDNRPERGTRGNVSARDNYEPPLVRNAPKGPWNLDDRMAAARNMLTNEAFGSEGKARGKTWVGAVNTRTGEVAITTSGRGNCAEPNILVGTGWNMNDVQFTRALMLDKMDGVPGGKAWQERAVCTTCQGIFPRDRFAPGTSADPGGAWA